MLKITKYILYLIAAAVIVGLFWFLPKYSYVQKNPGYCTNLTEHLYYCGNKANLKETFEKTLENKDKIQDTAETLQQVNDAVNNQNQ